MGRRDRARPHHLGSLTASCPLVPTHRRQKTHFISRRARRSRVLLPQALPIGGPLQKKPTKLLISLVGAQGLEGTIKVAAVAGPHTLLKCHDLAQETCRRAPQGLGRPFLIRPPSPQMSNGAERQLNACYGSKADIDASSADVRFTPQSRHSVAGRHRVFRVRRSKMVILTRGV
jgi:hypothetical protein